MAFWPRFLRSIDATPGAQGRLVDVELVGVHRALHHRLAETVGGGQEHDVAETGVRVEREHHAGRAEIASHHVLHADRKRHGVVIEIVVHAVGDGPVVEEGRVYLVHRGEQVLLAAHVEEGFLLPCERGLRQILRGCRGAHGDGELGAAAHLAKCSEDLVPQALRERSGEHPAADLLADRGKPLHVVDVERAEHLGDAAAQILLREKIAVGVRGRRESPRNRDPEARQRRDHLADRGVLAAHDLDVLALQFLKRNDVRIHRFLYSLLVRPWNK